MAKRKYDVEKPNEDVLLIFLGINGQNTKYKIFESSVDLFSKKGYEGVSIREIAKSVGIKESSIYNHFSSKEELLRIIIDFFEIEIKKAVLSDEEKKEFAFVNPPKTLLKESMKKFMKFADTELMAKIYRILIVEQFRNERARNILLSSFINGPEESLKKYFKILMDTGFIEKSDPDYLAKEYSNSIFSMVFKLSMLDSYGLNTHHIEDDIWGYIDYFSDRIPAAL